MFDLWAFLLQTLSVSGVAALLLLIKWLFRDKLPPKWHFGVWGVLGVMMLVPAGWNGHYTLVNWQFVVELLKGLAGDYSFTQVLFPVPVITGMPNTVIEWLFAVYVTGVIVFIVRYIVLYARLRKALFEGQDAPDSILEQVDHIAAQLNVKPCRVIMVSGVPSAFVCGIFHPVLVVPASESIDDKIIMHELFHLKSRDTIWSIVICALRCLHWCNPLIVYCAGCASNDMEARCDQRVLEQLEGEERRDYGMALLSMVNERFARTPGTTCVNNGGKRIRERIETIARFKKYPVGMRLVSICVVVLLTTALIIGVPATRVLDPYASFPTVSYASARSVPCTTVAGAFDTYAKAVMTNNGYYRIMCAPSKMQAELQGSKAVNWISELPDIPVTEHGYYIYNLKELDDSTYEGMIVFELDSYDGDEYEIPIAVQNLRVEKEKGRWIVTPLDDFRRIVAQDSAIGWGCEKLPGTIYSGEIDDFRVEVIMQTIHIADNPWRSGDEINYYSSDDVYYDMNPKPSIKFSSISIWSRSSLIHLGSQEERDLIKGLGLSTAEVYPGDKRPDVITELEGYDESGAGNDGQTWDSRKMKSGWGPRVVMCAGSGTSMDVPLDLEAPEYYIANLYINKEFAGQADLYPEEEMK